MAKKASGSPRPSSPKNWTFMVYMVAGESRDLDAVAVRDLREMERGCKDNKNVNVVVQLDRHWPSGPQRYEVHADGSRLLRQLPGDTNMGKGRTLTNFLQMVARSKKYRAENYCLILWGHAFGLGFGRDHDDPLVLAELKKALTKFKEARAYVPSKKDGRLEILGTNSCSMSYAEAAFELRDSAQLMLASQITLPFAGWPYDVIFKRIDDSTDVDALSQLVVDAYVTQFDDLPGGDRLAMTRLNLAGANGLDAALETLAQAIDKAILYSGFSSDTLAQLRDLFMGAAGGDVRPLIDLTTLLRSLAPEDETPLSDDIASAANEVLAILHVGKEPHGKLVLSHKGHRDLEDLHGVGIFAPFVTDEGIVKRLGLSDAPAGRGKSKVLNGREHYEQLEVFPGHENAAWPKLVYDGLRRTIPADLILAIDGISELQTGDRADVAQIIMSIEASLNQFDRAVRQAKCGVKATLSPPASLRRGKSGTPAKPVHAFSAASLLLFAPGPLEALQQAEALKRHMAPQKGQAQVRAGATGRDLESTESEIVTHLIRVEKALSRVERVTRRGLIHARFGLGLLAPNPRGFGLDPPKSGEGLDPPKSGEGLDPPKSGEGLDPPKSGEGLDPPKSGEGLPDDDGDLRVDRGMRRVAELFMSVGRAMQDLEQAAATVEHVARTALIVSPVSAASPEVTRAAASQQIASAFLTMEETSARARRVIRRALAHPIYGLGPGEGQLTYDVRQDLASRGGLDRRRLKLL